MPRQVSSTCPCVRKPATYTLALTKRTRGPDVAGSAVRVRGAGRSADCGMRGASESVARGFTGGGGGGASTATGAGGALTATGFDGASSLFSTTTLILR